MTTLTMGRREIQLGGKYLGSLQESGDIRGDVAALRNRLAQNGYLLLRGLHQPEKVLAARESILKNLASNGQLDPRCPLMDAIVAEGARGAFLGGSKALTRTPEFLGLVESPEVMGFFSQLLDGEVLTYDYKWLRVVGPGDFTGA